MKKYLKYLFIILLIVFIKLVVSYGINEKIIRDYKRGDYDTGTIKLLYFLNINEPYIVYYNEGNILFYEGQFQDSIDNYNKALKKHPPKKRVCDIRVNLSLSMIYTISSENDYKSILKEAKENLYENGCAHKDDDNGYSKEAEALEKEIDQLLNSEFKGKPKPKPGNVENDPDSDVEAIITSRNKTANESRNDSLQTGKEIDSGIISIDGKRW